MIISVRKAIQSLPTTITVQTRVSGIAIPNVTQYFTTKFVSTKFVVHEPLMCMCACSYMQENVAIKYYRLSMKCFPYDLTGSLQLRNLHGNRYYCQHLKITDMRI